MTKVDWSFQDEAVENILKRFKGDRSYKTIMEVPTGGGKTTIAAKAIKQLLDQEIISKSNKLLWVAHKKELIIQAAAALTSQGISLKESEKNHYTNDCVCVSMKYAGSEKINTDKNIGLVVIDEAHHAAASSYSKFFQKEIGVLGLTATPSRNDEKELEFEDVCYSIRFRDLINKGVILDPIIRQIQNSDTEINVSDLNYEDLEKFNIPTRNWKIVEKLLGDVGQKKYKKVIIFAGTINYTKELYKKLKQNNTDPDLHIGYITQGECESHKFSKNASRNEYLQLHRQKDRSILVNPSLLGEGYDDPKINTVLFAVPTNSKLQYLQCVGRAIRVDKQFPNKKAYVLEIDDNLPNISYRIDNRHLFNELSDELEPEVEDIKLRDQKHYSKILKELKKENNIIGSIKFLPNENFENITLVLFHPDPDSENKESSWLVMKIDPSNRKKYSRIFNYISNNMFKFAKEIKKEKLSYKYLTNKLLREFKLEEDKFMQKNLESIIYSMVQGYDLIGERNKIKNIKILNFSKIKNKYPSGIEEFLEDCYNSKDLLNEFTSKLEEDQQFLVKFPLPLGSFMGMYISNKQFKFCENILDLLEEIKDKKSPNLHMGSINEEFLKMPHLPIPYKLLNTFPTIIRNNLKNKYFFKLGEENGC